MPMRQHTSVRKLSEPAMTVNVGCSLKPSRGDCCDVMVCVWVVARACALQMLAIRRHHVLHRVRNIAATLDNHDRNFANLRAPFLWAGAVDRIARGIHRDDDGHIDHIEFVDRFHAEIFKCHKSRGLDRFRN
jgi:hypothetical protein